MSDRVTQTAAQANAAQVECLTEEIRYCGCQGKHKQKLAHSRDEMRVLKVMKKGDPRSGTAR